MPKKGKSTEELEEYFTEYELRVVGSYLSNRLSQRKDNGFYFDETKYSKDMLMGITKFIDDEDLIEKFDSLMNAEAKRLLELVKDEYMPEHYEEGDNSLITEDV